MSSENQNPNQYPLGEPSVLDYVKSLLRINNGHRIQIPGFVEEETVSVGAGHLVTDTALRDIMVAEPQVDSEEQASRISKVFPWRSLLAFMIALLGQRLFEPPPTSYLFGYILYVAALAMLGWAIWCGEWTLPA